MKPMFIVFEGIDGSGTSTQAQLLAKYLGESGQPSIVTTEPSTGPIGSLIREGMKRRVIFSNDKEKFDHQMAYLFAADRHDHLYNDVDGVFKLINDGNHVISTRYYFSSFAYHCENEDDFEFVRSLNNKFPEPDIVIYLDNPIQVSLKRMENRSHQDVYENEVKLTAVSNNYKRIFSEYNGKLLQVKADLPVSEVHNSIIKFVIGGGHNGK
ncbi:MAG: dTMP kinase [Geobacter sp.]|nr:dTMP kinase [Geobacter sp.]